MPRSLHCCCDYFSPGLCILMINFADVDPEDYLDAAPAYASDDDDDVVFDDGADDLANGGRPNRLRLRSSISERCSVSSSCCWAA